MLLATTEAATTIKATTPRATTRRVTTPRATTRRVTTPKATSPKGTTQKGTTPKPGKKTTPRNSGAVELVSSALVVLSLLSIQYV